MFASGEGYLGTELLSDASRPGRYLTIDRWSSSAAFDGFMAGHEEAYASVDARLEGLAAREVPLGSYEAIEGR